MSHVYCRGWTAHGVVSYYREGGGINGGVKGSYGKGVTTRLMELNRIKSRLGLLPMGGLQDRKIKFAVFLFRV